MLAPPRMTKGSNAAKVAIRCRRYMPAKVIRRDAVFGARPIELSGDFSDRFAGAGCGAHDAPANVRARRACFLLLFSACVTASRWSGLTQQVTTQRWSISKPSGIGPLAISYAMRCAASLVPRRRNLAYPCRLLLFVQSQHPVFGSGKTQSGYISRRSTGARHGPRVAYSNRILKIAARPWCK
jgi:hypothetical protein